MSQAEFQTIRELVTQYKELTVTNNPPQENEITSNIVAPLLRCFGWPSVFIAYERSFANSTTKGNADIILHNDTNRDNESGIVGIIECKKHSSFSKQLHVQKTLTQLNGYAKCLKQKDTLLLIATDGYKFIHLKDNNQFILDIEKNDYEDFKAILSYELYT